VNYDVRQELDEGEGASCCGKGSISFPFVKCLYFLSVKKKESLGMGREKAAVRIKWALAGRGGTRLRGRA